MSSHFHQLSYSHDTQPEEERSTLIVDESNTSISRCARKDIGVLLQSDLSDELKLDVALNFSSYNPGTNHPFPSKIEYGKKHYFQYHYLEYYLLVRIFSKVRWLLMSSLLLIYSRSGSDSIDNFVTLIGQSSMKRSRHTPLPLVTLSVLRLWRALKVPILVGSLQLIHHSAQTDKSFMN